MSVAARGQSFQVRHENRDNFGLSGSRATAIGMNCDLIVIGRFPGRARRSDFSEQLDVMFWQFLQLMARSLESDCLSCKNQEDQKQRRVGFEKHLKLYKRSLVILSTRIKTVLKTENSIAIKYCQNAW